MNAGQMVEDVRPCSKRKTEVAYYDEWAVLYPSPDEVIEFVKTKMI
jgi:hypothetical protein